MPTANQATPARATRMAKTRAARIPDIIARRPKLAANPSAELADRLGEGAGDDGVAVLVGVDVGSARRRRAGPRPGADTRDVQRDRASAKRNRGPGVVAGE